MTTVSSQTDYETQEAIVHMNRISKTSRNLGITLSTNYNKAMHVTNNAKIKDIRGIGLTDFYGIRLWQQN